jgi:ABC-2 type transport system permease protein
VILESLRLEASAFRGFVERQKDLYRRYWLWEAVWLIYSLVSVMSIGFLASGLGSLGAAGPAFDMRQAQLYLLAGSVIWSYLSLLFFEVAFAISWERWEGTIEYTFMAPVHRVTHLLAITTFGVVYGLARMAVVVLVAALTFHLDFSRSDLFAAAVVLAASTPPLIGLGILTSILPLLSPEKGDQMTVAVQGILLLVSGVYYPLAVLPLPLRLVGEASPLTYALEGIRGSVIQGRSVMQMLPTIGLLLAMGVVMVPAALMIFAGAERRAKRLGLLKRSG